MIFDKQIQYITVTGGIPFIALLILPTTLWLNYQTVGILYLSVIISFIAGINWLIACQRRTLGLLFWAILLSLLVWVIASIAISLSITIFGWVGLWILLNIAWAIDHQAYQQDSLLRDLRMVGSITLNILLLAIIIRIVYT